MAAQRLEGQILTGEVPETRNWHAWNDLMPPRPDFVHVTGLVLVPNAGVQPILTYREPQGTNPAILLLDLHLCQMPGAWERELMWKPVHYKSVLGATRYSRAIVLFAGSPLVGIDVFDVHLAGTPESRQSTDASTRRPSAAASGGEAAFPCSHPICLSGTVSTIEVDFCMDGVRHRLTLPDGTYVRVKGETQAIDDQLDNESGKRVLVTACGHFELSIEQGCQYLLASLVVPARDFDRNIRPQAQY